MTDPNRRDSAPDEGADLSALYARADSVEPPPHLDELILRTARNAGDVPRSGRRQAPFRRWPAPVGMAALLLLSGTLYLVLPPALREPAPPAGFDAAYLPEASAPVVTVTAPADAAQPEQRAREAAARESARSEAEQRILRRPASPAAYPPAAEPFVTGESVADSVAPTPVAARESEAGAAGDQLASALKGRATAEVMAGPGGEAAGRGAGTVPPTLFAGDSFVGIISDTGDGIGGFGVELAQRLAEGTGIRPGFKIMPLRRALEGARQGWIPALVGVYYTAERDEFLDYTREPFAHDQIVLFARSGAAPDWTGDPAQLDGLRVGIIPAWSYGRELDAWLARAERPTARSLDLLLRMLVEGRLDILPAPARDMQPRIEALEDPDQVIALEPAVDGSGLYFAFSRAAGMEWLRAHFDRRFEELRAAGHLDELRARHGLDPER